MVEQEIPIQEPKEKHKDSKESHNTERVLKIFSVIVGIITIVGLIWIKTINPEFPFLYIILIGGFIILISVLTYFGFAIYRKFQEKPDPNKEYNNKLPKPISLAELRRLAQDALCDEYFCNHTVGCINEKYVHAGAYNERIYVYHTHALYKDDMKHGEIFIIINSHFSNDLKTILIDPSPGEINRCISNLASVKEKLPQEEFESNVTYNPITNAYQSSEKKSIKREEDKKSEKKEDLV